MNFLKNFLTKFGFSGAVAVAEMNNLDPVAAPDGQTFNLYSVFKS